MRIGKKPTKSRFWPKAGLNGKPKHISPEVVVGQLSPDIASTIYAPWFREIAGQVLEQHASEYLEYEVAVQEARQQRDAEKRQQQQQKATSEDQESDETETLSEAEIDADGETVVITEEEEEEDEHDDDNYMDNDHVDESADAADFGIEAPKLPLFHSQFVIEEMSTVFEETSNHFFSKQGAWKTQANMAKFERLMDEKYGVFRPFIKQHPQLEEAIRSLQRRYATGYFSAFREKDPPIPKSTAVIVLFMMQRGKVRWEIMLLTGVFLLVGLQPWALVLIVGTIQMLLSRRKHTPVGSMKRRIEAVESYYEECTTTKEKHQKLEQPVGSLRDTALPADDNQLEYDTILLGSGAATLYTGALLARAGRKILVLSPDEDASGCVTLQTKGKNVKPEYETVPFDIQQSNVAKFSAQIKFLAPALSTNTDLQGGVRFAQIGSNADNHAFEILEIPGMHTNGSSHTTVLTAENVKQQLMDEAAAFLGDGWPNTDGTPGNSGIGAYMAACEQISSTSNLFYASKVVPDVVNNARSDSVYAQCATRYTAGLLNQSFPLNAPTRSLAAAIGMRAENLRPNSTSLAAHVSHMSSAISGEGMYYPIGGPRALCHALANVIERNGGRVVTKAPVKELLFEDDPTAAANNNNVILDEGERIAGQEQQQQQASSSGKDDATPCPRCVGVKLQDDRELKFDKDALSSSSSSPPVVLSMIGLIETFIRLLPDDIRVKHKVPRGLPALAESRPHLKVLFLLKGSASDLQLTGADYYRLPNAARAIDEVNPQTGQVKYGDIGWSTSDNSGSSSMATGESSGEEGKDETGVADATNNADQVTTGTGAPGARKKRQKANVRYDAGRSWLHLSFPSAKDPSFEERHGKITTCVATIEADDDFVTCFESKPKLYVPKQHSSKDTVDRLLQRVQRDLLALYPQLEGNILHGEVRTSYPFLTRSLVHSPERYAAKGVRADTPYPGLYVGGSDLTLSGSFSGGIVGGWLAATAVSGYSYLDILFLQKTITSDIAQFLEVPVREEGDEEDLAVPFTVKTTPEPEEKTEEEGADNTPESADEKKKSK